MPATAFPTPPQHHQPPAGALLRKAEAARLLGVCPRSIDGYIASGRLRIVKLGAAVRIDPRDLESFIAAAKQ